MCAMRTIFGHCYVYVYDIIFGLKSICIWVNIMIISFEIERYFVNIYICVFGL
ncbi:hypothetical protein F383_03273 [Gossypium arboreum]|uniref:Uncharacterized protein n=1 Tax=Gossypium arboreum TaxID=29729 RepID=A0A0B0PJT4_GOSAR|nr:hypothetical protein F383_03273 [Gossypium arboreum]